MYTIFVSIVLIFFHMMAYEIVSYSPEEGQPTVSTQIAESDIVKKLF